MNIVLKEDKKFVQLYANLVSALSGKIPSSYGKVEYDNPVRTTIFIARRELEQYINDNYAGNTVAMQMIKFEF